MCVGCTADGAGGRVEVCVVSGRRTVRVEEEQGGGEEKRQQVPAAAPACVGRKMLGNMGLENTKTARIC